MGITGLLPALKSIQRQRHLSEFAGQTVAVDAYVFLHRGVYSCATDLALGKPTSKYVHYAMSKFRLMMSHGIIPYIVFDGGPLPAKRGTETERQQKRDESLSKGKIAASRGNEKEAREHFIKCVDVTPQMAYQLIKALQAERIQYVVAPYEADAQMTFLERTGKVDAILTEDSDLLVFGCKNVLYKFDPVAATVIHISSDDFGTITGSGSEISLRGWNQAEFRMMAILSGCDYIPSIPGVGLKTACSLLRKYKTADKVVRVIQMEGKKRVPKGYIDNVVLADKCFLHQRVFDPDRRCLVHLADVDEAEWDPEADEYVGPNLDSALAQAIAVRDADPITYEPMVDINPSFKRPLNDITNSEIVGKGKEKDTTTLKQPSSPKKTPKQTGGLFNFWGANPIIPSSSQKKSVVRSAGKASGKRTLSEAMEQDLTTKKQKVYDTTPSHSKFFTPGASTSKVVLDAGKENDDAELDLDEEDDGSLLVHVREDEEIDIGLEEDFALVEQEDGYLSPASPNSDLDDLSSPVRPDVDVLGLESVSSPIISFKSPRQRRLAPSPTPSSRRPIAISTVADVNLRSILGFSEDDEALSDPADLSGPSPSPLTPSPPDLAHQVDPLSDPEEEASRGGITRSNTVAAGWKQKWALPPGPVLRRSETNVTPAGRHPRLSMANDMFTNSAPTAPTPSSIGPVRTGSRGRKSLPIQLSKKDPKTPAASRGLDRFRYA